MNPVPEKHHCNEQKTIQFYYFQQKNIFWAP